MSVARALFAGLLRPGARGGINFVLPAREVQYRSSGRVGTAYRQYRWLFC